MTQKSITVLLEKLKAGEKNLLDDIYSQLYNEIKAVAANQISQLKYWRNHNTNRYGE